jgi:ankyrin repeat protein
MQEWLAQRSFGALATGIDISQQRDSDGYGPLFYAIWSNPNVGVMRVLVKAGADVNVVEKGWTPLLDLVSSNDYALEIERYRILFAAGADARYVCSDGTNALLLLSKDIGTKIQLSSDTLGAGRVKAIQIAKMLLEKGLEVNSADNGGNTPLMNALSGNETDDFFVAFLLKSGANANAADKTGRTVLMFAAARRDDPAVVKILLTAGADLNAKDAKGVTALMYAVDAESLDAMKLLINAGVDASIQNADGDTALTLAKSMKHGYIGSPQDKMLALLGAKPEPTSKTKSKSASEKTIRVPVVVMAKIRAELAFQLDVLPTDVINVKVIELIDSGGPVIQYRGTALINFSEDHQVQTPFLLSIDK